MKVNTFLAFLILLALIYPYKLMGQQPITIKESMAFKDQFNIENSKIWVDSLNQLEDLRKIDQKVFQAIPNFKFSTPNHAYWIEFDLKNGSSTFIKYWLHVGVFDSLILIKKQEDTFDIKYKGLLVEYTADQKQAFQALQADKYGFEIVLAPNTETRYYLGIKNSIRFETPISGINLQYKEKKIFQSGKQRIYFLLFSAAFFGIFLFFIVFSLFQFIQNRDASYYYYAIYLGLSVFYFWWKFEKSNSIVNFLFTQNPSYYYYYEVPLGILIYISYFLFVLHFLNAKKEFPKFYTLLRTSIPIILIYLLFNIGLAYLSGLSTSWEMNYWIRFILLPFSFYAIYLVLKSKHQLGFYIISGSAFLLLGGLLTTIFSKTYVQHYLGPWDIPLLPIQLGMLIEVMFFSTGLAYKSRLAVQEKTLILLDLKQREKDADFHKKRKEELTKLYTNLSHEFRTPLTVILGSLEQVKGNQREKGLIRRNGQQLLALVNKILNLNKLEANKMKLSWEQGDIMAFIRYCAEPFELLAKKKKQTFEIFCSPKQLVMDIDGEKLQDIINNLVSNAIKFTPNEGKIRIDVYKGDQDILHIDISDSGSGIDQKHHQFIFDYYTQLPDTDGGTGIGLALVKELVQLQGGQIYLKSEIGQGSTFSISLPIHHNASVAKKRIDIEDNLLKGSPSLVGSSSLNIISGRSTILLVEDHEDVQTYMKQLLAPFYNVFSVENGVLALQKTKEIRPDLIISDVMMPEMDGYELCQQLKDNPNTEHIPIVLVTAKASQCDQLKGLEYKADAYLVKPFNERELLLRLKQLLQKHKILESRSGNIFTKNGLVEKTDSEIILFIEKLHKVLNKNMQNEKFKAKTLCQELGMNHVSLNNKIKKYSGQTTAQYIRNYRLNLAKELLQTTDMTVAEISYEVGILEPSNFNNMFKKSFGKSPKQWKLNDV